MSEWIEWAGGECPVKEGTWVEVQFRCGETLKSRAQTCAEYADCGGTAAYAYWDNDNSQLDILRYRLCDPPTSDDDDLETDEAESDALADTQAPPSAFQALSEERLKETFSATYGDPAPDLVNSPPHYTAGTIECIDAIRAALTPEEFRGYCKGNVLKYVHRERHKGGDESLQKAIWYLNKALEQ